MLPRNLLYENENTAIYCLGGHPQVTPDVGRNCFIIQSKITRNLLVLEAGLQFKETPDDNGDQDHTDFGILRPYWERVKGVLTTHIHLDHCGDLPGLYSQMPKKHRPPVIGSPFTMEFVMRLFDRFHFGIPPFFGIGGDEGVLHLGDFEVSLVAVPHSTPHTRSFLIRTPRRLGNGQDTILFLSDYKMTDCSLTQGLAESFTQTLNSLRGQVDVMLFDALYPDEEGKTPSEDSIIPALDQMFSLAPGNLICSCFASNTLRLENVFNRVVGKRQFLAQGRTMKRLLNLAQSCGWLDESTYGFDPTTLYKNWVMMATGCQGEEYAVLTRLSRGEGPFDVRPNYSFGLLANAIPGKLPAVYNMVVNLLAQIPDGLFFVSDKMYEKLGITASNLVALPNLHVSGHGRRGDHMEVLARVEPAHLIPYHYPANKQVFIDNYYR